jgi:hypothetical protein
MAEALQELRDEHGWDKAKLAHVLKQEEGLSGFGLGRGAHPDPPQGPRCAA